MTAPQFADISVWQSASIDWQKYKAWSSAADGIARISLRSSYGTGFTDDRYHSFRTAATNAGIQIIHYHYAYPSVNSPEAEADWQFQVTGLIGPNDVVMLDYEENEPQATADWAYRWLARQEQNYGRLPVIYASDAYARARLQDSRLTRYPLVLANWTYSPDTRPPCPPPWTHYTYLQYSDKATVPGIPGAVDANVYLGGSTPVPTTTPGGENAVFIDNIDQLEPNETEDACVAFSAANVFYSTQPGTSNPHTAEDVDQLADKWYTRETGSITNSNGISVPQLHTILDGMGLSWEPIPITSNGPANDEAVRTALRAGKLVIVCAAESSFFDLEIGRPPYSWNTQPFNHCIVATGNITSGPWQGNVWVRDTVAVSGGYPPSTKRPYDIAKMQYVSLTAVTPSWLRGDTSMTFTVPSGWTDDGTTLTASNGIQVKAGFRQYIGTHPWDPADVPLAPESNVNPVEMGYSQPGGNDAGSRLICMYSELCWTASRGVYRASVGRELASVLQKLASTTAPTPAQVDTSVVEADINAIVSEITSALASTSAKALTDLKKL